MALARFLVDKSALARTHEPAVLDVLGPLITAGLVGLCGIVETEMLVSARNVGEHDETRLRLRSLERLPMPDEVWSWVADAQRRLTERGLHRSVPIPDLLIAATAHRHQLTVLHYDSDFDVIADISDVGTRWVVPRDSLGTSVPPS
jgi:predicted nucleic acid-binding protein